MVDFHVQPSQLHGTIRIPSSKSQSLRAILFDYLAGGGSNITGLLDSPDIEAAKRCVDGSSTLLDVGNSGILLRFLSAIVALRETEVTITGDESIRTQRPMHDLIQGLTQLGVSVKSNHGFAPVTICGPMKGGRAVLSGHDSQPVSALLIAAAFSPHATEIIVTNPGEIPWVQLTLNWFDRLGIAYEHENFKRYYVSGNSVIHPFSYAVPGDLSSMAFPLAAAIATKSELRIENIDFDDPQGDKKILTILEKMGAQLEYQENSLIIRPSTLKGIEVDINDCIDVITPLAVIACFAEGKTTIRNAAVARQKECDRISCITAELGKMGGRIEALPDGLVVHQSSLKGALVSSHNDHRMAMALAVAGLGAIGETIVRDVSCVNKTYNNFCYSLVKTGSKINYSL